MELSHAGGTNAVETMTSSPTEQMYHHCHRRNKRDKLYLSASLSGNSERQQAVFHWVFHHRHGLNTKNNSSNNSDDNNNNINN